MGSQHQNERDVQISCIGIDGDNFCVRVVGLYLPNLRLLKSGHSFDHGVASPERLAITDPKEVRPRRQQLADPLKIAPVLCSGKPAVEFENSRR